MKLSSQIKINRKSVIALIAVILAYSLSTVLITIASASSVSSPSFASAVNLSNDSGKAKDPAVSSYGLNVFVAWTEGSKGIMFRSSSNGGVTWNPPTSSPAMKISPAKGSASFPVMFTQYQNTSDVLVSWSQTVPGSGLQVFAATSTNAGSSFNVTQVSPNITNGTAITPAVAGWGHVLYVSWYEQAGCTGKEYNGSGCIMVSTSTNDGHSWGAPVELNPSSDGEEQIVATQSAAYLVADGIYFSNSTNDGGNWSAPVRLYHVPHQGSSVNYGREPWVAASGNYVYTVWEANSTAGKKVGYVTIGQDSTNGGVTWSGNITENQNVKNDWEPENVAFGTNAFMTFHSLANQGIYVTSTQNAGGNWSTPALVSYTKLSSAFSHVFTSDGTNVFVMWGQKVSSSSTTWNAYVSYSGNAGSSWSSPIDISNNAQGTAAGNQDVTLFALSSSGTHCFAAWTYVSGATTQVYFAHS